MVDGFRRSRTTGCKGVTSLVLNQGDVRNPKPGEGKSYEKGSPIVMWRGRKFGKSFAQVVGGESSKSRELKEQNTILKILSVGNGWLDRSAVASSDYE
ncbi:hypothetical protein RHMOL_Rhmol02G0140100 [Rhododendron molle]|uniref:Uncharacterized protein n=1 Tax=Rhododendron molle TaxID=49168 RepID=A0ACC0PQB5_RHOML|nr:hypothetical protein RHMOL_Rhmol02G0140100 [Rhododendron molle]